jgi:hypothetical protein
MRYIIYVQLITGEVIRAFTWLGLPAMGIIRARHVVESRGYEGVMKAWAVPAEDFDD